MNESDKLQIAAQHEAGHCVMRWLLTGAITDTLARSDGSGLSRGTFRVLDRVQDKILIELAGIAAESSFGFNPIDLETSRFVDLDNARFWIGVIESQRVGVQESSEADVMSPKDALEFWYDEACNRLWPYFDLVEMVAEVLESNPGKVVTGEQLRPIFQDYTRPTTERF